MSEVSQGRGDPKLPEGKGSGKSEVERLDQLGHQDRPMSENDILDEALEETLPTSDPIAPARIDGPND